MKEFKKFVESADEAGIIQSIQANPKDKLVWSVYADWLEEHGDPRSDIIRMLLGKKTMKTIQEIDRSILDIDGEFARLLHLGFPVFDYAHSWNTSVSNTYKVMALVKTGPSYSGRQTEEILNSINKLIKGHGIATIRGERNSHDNYYMDIVAEYVNMGDAYSLTVLHDIPRHKFFITDYGTWVEKNARRYGIQ